jgi:hypothetical protein
MQAWQDSTNGKITENVASPVHELSIMSWSKASKK